MPTDFCRRCGSILPQNADACLLCGTAVRGGLLSRIRLVLIFTIGGLLLHHLIDDQTAATATRPHATAIALPEATPRTASVAAGGVSRGQTRELHGEPTAESGVPPIEPLRGDGAPTSHHSEPAAVTQRPIGMMPASVPESSVDATRAKEATPAVDPARTARIALSDDDAPPADAARANDPARPDDVAALVVHVPTVPNPSGGAADGDTATQRPAERPGQLTELAVGTTVAPEGPTPAKLDSSDAGARREAGSDPFVADTRPAAAVLQDTTGAPKAVSTAAPADATQAVPAESALRDESESAPADENVASGASRSPNTDSRQTESASSDEAVASATVNVGSAPATRPADSAARSSAQRTDRPSLRLTVVVDTVEVGFDDTVVATLRRGANVEATLHRDGFYWLPGLGAWVPEWAVVRTAP